MESAWPVHIVTVAPDEDEIHRTEVLMEVLKPRSSRIVESLQSMSLEDESSKAEATGDAVTTVVRLSGRAQTDVLAWLGAKGRVTTEVAILGFADGIIIEPGQPPRAIGVLASAFVSAIASSKQGYDASAAAFIIGVTDETRAMAASLSRLGYKRLLIVDSDDQKTEQMVQILRKRLFGIDIQAVPRSGLTQVPNESSMAVNLVTVAEESLLEDVSYLNFLKKGGVWIDWTCAISKLGYGDDITNAGAQVFSGDLIRAWREIYLLSATGRKPEELGDLAREIHKAWSSPSTETQTHPS